MGDRILVVDDREDVAELLAAILDGYDVTCETDGHAALARLERERFAVVLTDVKMPEVDGFDVLRAVKRTSPASQVLVLTGFAAIADAVLAVKEGAFDYLEKPLGADEVRDAVQRAADAYRREALASPTVRVSLPFREAVDAAREDASCEYLTALMREFGGCVTKAAEHAGVERESLHRILRRHGIRSEAFKPRAREET